MGLSEDKHGSASEFRFAIKRQLAREFLDGRAGLHERARRFSISRNLIRLWIRKYKAGEFNDELAEALHVAEYERKIAELERKVGQLTMEVDLLKRGGRTCHARPAPGAVRRRTGRPDASLLFRICCYSRRRPMS